MREERKLVSVVFADVVGSTAFAGTSDPEVVRRVMSRHFERMRVIAETHGGTVEKFAGDAVMVVFGVPRVHDDDAERAVRAALAMRGAADPLTVRVGVNTGDAVTSSRPDGQFLVSGDTVNIAARLQQGGDEGEVIVGALTERLTRQVIEYRPRDSIAAKGKPDALVAFTAVRALSETPVQSRGIAGLSAPLIGRQRELRLFRDTFDRTAEERHPHLFTVIGNAGVGKSRLVAEALTDLAKLGARALRGRCLPYGHGVAYWPFAEMLQEDAGINLADGRDVGLAKLERWLGEIAVAGERQAIRGRLAVALGYEDPAIALSDVPAERIDREVAWGLRRYLEAVAGLGPLIVVIDDLQWVEPAVIAVIEQVTERARESPLLLVAIARPELLERQPGWGAGGANSTTITLDPLSQEDTAFLISQLLEVEALPDELRARIVERSEGTPLYCEEFLRMLIDEGKLVRSGKRWRAVKGSIDVPVPHSIQALLAARLDGLPDAEKRTLQAASVIGERFGTEQVRALSPDLDVDATLDSLARKGLTIEAGSAADASDVRFKHLLIRDAAYSSLSKAERAALHEHFGSLLEARAQPSQLVEILAHHAERAFALTRELELEDEFVEARALRALEWCLQAGERALARTNGPALESFLATARAAGLSLSHGGGAAASARILLLDAGSKRMQGDYHSASALLEAAAAQAEKAGETHLVAAARLGEVWVHAFSVGDVEGALEVLDQKVARAVAACRKAGDKRGELEARWLGNLHLWAEGPLPSFLKASEGLLVDARGSGEWSQAARVHWWLGMAHRNLGQPGPADEHVNEADRLSQELGLRDLAAQCTNAWGRIAMLKGDLAGWEAANRRYLAAAEEFGGGTEIIGALRWLGDGLLRQGRADESEEALARAVALSEGGGERWHRTELLAMRARVALARGRLDEAGRYAETAVQLVRKYDVTAVAETAQAVAEVRAAQGRDEEAESSFKAALKAIGGNGYGPIETDVSLAYARFLAERDRAAEAMALIQEREQWLKAAAYTGWQTEIAGIRSTIAATQNR